jgi:hypothetical protein
MRCQSSQSQQNTTTRQSYHLSQLELQDHAVIKLGGGLLCNCAAQAAHSLNTGSTELDLICKKEPVEQRAKVHIFLLAGVVLLQSLLQQKFELSYAGDEGSNSACLASIRITKMSITFKNESKR